MHISAMKRMEWFVNNYIPEDRHIRVLDVGSYNVNGCYKPLFKGFDCEYVGVDIEKGPNVDIVLEDPYSWNSIENNSFDFVISGNAFEHIEYPWVTMGQIRNKLKDDGFACILAPFNLSEHKYPTDCYRYYPDGMIALAKWAGLKVVNCTTGGVPEGVDVKQWILSENYDDTMLIACKTNSEELLKNLPKLTSESRSFQIFKS